MMARLKIVFFAIGSWTFHVEWCRQLVLWQRDFLLFSEMHCVMGEGCCTLADNKVYWYESYNNVNNEIIRIEMKNLDLFTLIFFYSIKLLMAWNIVKLFQIFRMYWMPSWKMHILASYKNRLFWMGLIWYWPRHIHHKMKCFSMIYSF